jgi:capsular exopolysaccharide synthesis family protein
LARRQLWIVLLTTAAVVGAAAYVVTGGDPSYQATAVVRLANQRSELTQGITATGLRVPGYGADPLQTQIAILRSRGVIGRAVSASGSRLQLRPRPVVGDVISSVAVADDSAPDSAVIRFEPASVTIEFAGSVGSAPYGEPVTTGGVTLTVSSRPAGVDVVVADVVSQESAVNLLLTNLQVVPRSDTDIVDVHFTSSNPYVAQRVVNTVVQTFQAVDTEAAQQSARRRREFLDGQLVRNDSLLSSLQQQLSTIEARSAAQQQEEIRAATRATLVELDLRRQELEAQNVTFASLLDQAESAVGPARRAGLTTLMSAPDLGSNLVVTRSYEELLQFEAAREARLSAGAARTDPDVVQADRLAQGAESTLFAALRSHLSAREAELRTMRELRDRTETALLQASAPVAAETAIVQLQHEVETLGLISDLLREEYERARIAEAVEAGVVEIVDLATRPGSLVDTGASRSIAFAGVLGLMLGVGLGYLRESLDTAIHVTEDVETATQLPALVTVPRLTRTRPRNGARLRLGGAAHTPGDTVGLEAYRMLCASLSPAQDQAVTSLLITSAKPREGKSTTAAHLALASVELGYRVLLIDGDLSHPTLHKVFAVPRSPGLIDVLHGRCDLSDAIVPTSLEPLSILPAGMPQSGEVAALSRHRTETLLQEAATQFNRILIDSAPVLLVANTSVLANAANGVILVTRSGHTDRRTVAEATTRLSLAGGNLVGVVLNDPDGELQRYDYSYGYTAGTHAGQSEVS